MAILKMICHLGVSVKHLKSSKTLDSQTENDEDQSRVAQMNQSIVRLNFLFTLSFGLRTSVNKEDYFCILSKIQQLEELKQHKDDDLLKGQLVKSQRVNEMIPVHMDQRLQLIFYPILLYSSELGENL
ncbi:uncharacterized protein LOC111023981 [Momordica charantia]|uniref:Uncharacterized protein LOC111023981 n=1 Tax=Momordica charantia TaxID=3673 RepID=A0A6J1DST4_MOMCH|nr:uncharacterized protein LOC111023981 [Momordica charantia]